MALAWYSRSSFSKSSRPGNEVPHMSRMISGAPLMNVTTRPSERLRAVVLMYFVWVLNGSWEMTSHSVLDDV